MHKIDENIEKNIIDELNERGWEEVLDSFSQTKSLLPYAFLWSTSDYFAPNGNDTGFDTLASFREWNTQNLHLSPLNFLRDLLESWEINIEEPYDEDYDSYCSMTYYQSVVGLAIAVVKIRGKFDKKLSTMAIEAINKYLNEIEVETKWVHLKECQEKALLIQGIFEKI